jgi:two-component system chemotaxis response regulator CheY
MMPEMDGQEVLDKIREMEKSHGIMGLDCVKIVMSTALDDFGNIKTSFRHQCDAYIVKPIDKDKIVQALINLQILE